MKGAESLFFQIKVFDHERGGLFVCAALALVLKQGGGERTYRRAGRAVLLGVGKGNSAGMESGAEPA